jgi:creatinine deaminase
MHGPIATALGGIDLSWLGGPFVAAAFYYAFESLARRTRLIEKGGENATVLSKMPPSYKEASPEDARFMKLAIDQARQGLAEGGVPIGAALVKDGTVIAVGRNCRVQQGSAIRHGEIDCLENAGRQPASVHAGATMYTTLSPCSMCSGAILLYKIPRVVIGESTTFVGAEDWLAAQGVELVQMDDAACKDLMRRFIARHPNIWNEDIGEE